MEMVLELLAAFIIKVAELGAGFLSFGLGFEPDIPEELMKINNL